MEAKFRFYEARRKADREDLLARLTRKHDDLLSYEVVAQVLQAYQQIRHDQPRMIPLDKVVGSVGRYRDFTRSFLPRSGVSPERWTRIDSAMSGLEGVPPIDVYQIGDVYFVADGNHRVSVARASGFKEIEAYVTEIQGDLALQDGDTPDEAIIKAECARFLAETRLGFRCGELEISFTGPGGFSRLLEHIEVHRYFMKLDHPDAGDVSFEQAADDWYRQVYLPIVAAIRQHKLLDLFPGRTAADLYIWVSGRIFELHRLYGEAVSPDQAVTMLEHETPNRFSRLVSGLVGRLAELAGGVTGPGDAVPELPSPAPTAAQEANSE